MKKRDNGQEREPKGTERGRLGGTARKQSRRTTRYHTDPVYRAACIARAKRRLAANRLLSPEERRRQRRERILSMRVRPQAVFKLRLGSAPLTIRELQCVLPHRRSEATEVKPRTLHEVAVLVGVTRERVRQIVAALLAQRPPEAR